MRYEDLCKITAFRKRYKCLVISHGFYFLYFDHKIEKFTRPLILEGASWSIRLKYRRIWDDLEFIEVMETADET